MNGRGLDLRIRLPSGYEPLEQRIREAVAKRLARGNCSVTLAIKSEARAGEIRLNEDALRQAAAAAERAREIVGAGSVALDGLLSLKGVLEIVDGAEADEAVSARLEAMLASFHDALDELAQARRAEGGRLEGVLAQKLREIETLAQAAEAAPARGPTAIQERLKAQLGRILETGIELDEARLYQEAVLLATKADIEEEIERLKAHAAAASALLVASGPVGRKFEFLAQEFHREANTLCAKANATEITRIGLQLKTAIDQLREQVQNIE